MIDCETQWKRIVKLLRDKHPPGRRVFIHVYPIRKKRAICGECWKSNCGKLFHVFVRRNQSIASRVDTLVHEWAHLLAWDAPGSDHNRAWGEAYARIYRTLEKYSWCRN